MPPSLSNVQRSTQRLTITIPQSVAKQLIARADYEGRSASNLAAYLLESALDPKRCDQNRTG